MKAVFVAEICLVRADQSVYQFDVFERELTIQRPLAAGDVIHVDYLRDDVEPHRRTRSATVTGVEHRVTAGDEVRTMVHLEVLATNDADVCTGWQRALQEHGWQQTASREEPIQWSVVRPIT